MPKWVYQSSIFNIFKNFIDLIRDTFPGVPSLPEPTTRPPPPPNVPKIVPNAISNNSPMGLNTVDLTTEVIPLNKPPQKPANQKSSKRKEEPIYEAVIPRHELPPVAEIPEPVTNIYEINQKLR